MALDFDSSRGQLVKLDRFVDLVRAITRATAEDETRWLEWKHHLDLSSAEHKELLAKVITGFANRLPDAAALLCGGWGYVVIGASHLGVSGMPPIDEADLSNRIGPYLDPELDWSLRHLTVDGVNVLVVEIRPPRAGDPVFTIRRTGDKVRDGDVFVRRNTKSERANSAEHRQLTERFCAAGRSIGGLTVLAEGHVHWVDFSTTAVEEWLKEERESCLASLTNDPNPPVKERSVLDGFNLDRFNAATGVAQWVPEDRTEDEYRDQVTRYLQKARDAVTKYVQGLPAERLSRTTFTVENSSDAPASGLHIEILLPGSSVTGVKRRKPDADGPSLPNPPRAWGPYKRIANSAVAAALRFADVHRSPGIDISSLKGIRPVSPPGGPTMRIEYPGSVRFVFDAYNVLARKRVKLGRFVLYTTEPIQPAQAEWTIRSANQEGVLSGRLDLPVSGTPWDVSTAIAASVEDDGS